MNAVIDIGSNSVLLLVALRREDGGVDVSHSEARITRLSQGAAVTRMLDPAAVDRTVSVLREYKKIADTYGAEIHAVATEGLRIAADPETFLAPAREALGTDVTMISGREEARLSYLSVARESGPGPLCVVDIGGASTELVAGQGENIEDIQSHPIGSVRLTESLLPDDPPTAAQLRVVEQAAAAALARQPLAPRSKVHGLAGTVTTAAALMAGLEQYDSDRIDGTEFSRPRVQQLRDALASVPLHERVRPMLPETRADVIVAGLTILLAVLDHCGAGTLVVRDRGLRYALV